MIERARIYLDHAATSWPKSDAVLDAMDEFARHCGASAGRGGYASAMRAGGVVAQTRHALASLINAESDDCLSFHCGGTAALNVAIHGLLRPGDHVVTTAAEHNSVLRPIEHLRQTQGIEVVVVPTDADGVIDADRLLSVVCARTRLVTLTSASNVTGAVQPIDEVGQKLANHPAFFLCDAAQSLGTLPIDVIGSRIDILAAPGHKSSGGPSGTGFLYLSRSLHSQMVPTFQGGTGNQSQSLSMPTALPAMLEAGNLNVPALAGWLAALAEMTSDVIQQRAIRASDQARRLHAGLASIDGLRLHAPLSTLPIASVTAADFDPTDLSAILDAEFGIETRAGLHCAALVHDCIQSGPAGTLRISCGHSTTDKEIDSVVAALEQIIHSSID